MNDRTDIVLTVACVVTLISSFLAPPDSRLGFPTGTIVGFCIIQRAFSKNPITPGASILSLLIAGLTVFANTSLPRLNPWHTPLTWVTIALLIPLPFLKPPKAKAGGADS